MWSQLHYADMAARQALDPSLNMTLPNCRKWKLPRFLSGKPVVVLASRANATARAVLNEQQLVDYVHATYDVTLEIVTEGSKSTWQIIDLLRVSIPHAPCDAARNTRYKPRASTAHSRCCLHSMLACMMP